MSFKIHTLRDNISQSTFNPYDSWYIQFITNADWSNTPYKLMLWVNTYGQYRTPFVDYTGQGGKFANNSFVNSLFASLPKPNEIFKNTNAGSVYSSIALAVKNTIISQTSAQARQDTWQRFKHDYLTKLIKEIYVWNHTEDEALKNAYDSFQAGLAEQNASYANSNDSWLGSILTPVLNFLGLGEFTGIISDVFGDITHSNQHLHIDGLWQNNNSNNNGSNNAGISGKTDMSTILLIGAGIFLFSEILDNKPKRKRRK